MKDEGTSLSEEVEKGAHPGKRRRIPPAPSLQCAPGAVGTQCQCRPPTSGPEDELYHRYGDIHIYRDSQDMVYFNLKE